MTFIHIKFMSESKNNRTIKKQLGQYQTPSTLSKKVLSKINFLKNDKVLEPSFGNGSFIIELIYKFLELNLSLDDILKNNIYGVEIDKKFYDESLKRIEREFGYLPPHNLHNEDFFEYNPQIKFDYIIGNPPFGGTIDYKYQNELDKIYGFRFNQKIKKETYSFFIVKSTDMLKTGGKIIFISSDTFLTIKTMEGLRKYLFRTGFSDIQRINVFSKETQYPMIILDYKKDNIKDYILLDKGKVTIDLMNLTKNFSWGISIKYAKYFTGKVLGDYIIASGGLSTGKNEYFIREIKNNKIIENYEFQYFQDPITLEKELERARLNRLSNKKIQEIKQKEYKGETRLNVRILECEPYVVELPNEDYSYYNRATNETLYSEPRSMIYWKDNGKAVKTFKKNGNWYLHGVGGAKFYGKEGLTWQLIASKINARYLPSGYILDNSAPVAILKEGVNKDELYFIIGWLLTSYATDIQKNVINHTKNIQNKDIERLPYPSWVKDKNKCVELIKKSIEDKKKGIINYNLQGKLDKLYEHR